MVLTKTTKQASEKYFVYGNFEHVMEESETIVSSSATCRDKDGEDVTASLIESGSETVDNRRLYIRIQNGLQSLSPYIFTIKITTSTGNEWEVDGKVTIKET